MSEARTYYVYALKDPRSSVAKPFYIGEGTGARAWDHELQPDDSPKGKRIHNIQEAGHSVLVSRLVEEVTEIEALRIEAKLIAAFGTKSTGGMLTNSIVPSLKIRKRKLRALNVLLEFSSEHKSDYRS